MPGLLVGLAALSAGAAGCRSEFRIDDAPQDTGRIDPEPQLVDLDEDGFSVEMGDCDDLDPDRGPSPTNGGPARFEEACDGIDNDCVGGVDVDHEGFELCAEHVEREQQLTIDVLFVVDRHAESGAARARAAVAAGEFVEHLVDRPGLDTHVGVVTTDLEDPAQRGKLVAPPTTAPEGEAGGGITGLSARTYSDQQADEEAEDAGDGDGDPGDGDLEPRRWIDGGDPRSAATQFLAAAIAGSGLQGEGPHGGRGVVDLATGSRLAGSTNDGFFRPDAPLALVFLSALEDASTGLGVESFLHSLEPGAVTAHAIVQEATLDCEGKSSPATQGASYLELAALTSGLHYDLCSEDYREPFSLLGQTIALDGLLASRFPLGAQAQPGSVRVSVALPGPRPGQFGEPVALRPGEISLADNGRTLVLLVAPPPPGARITIDFLRVP